MFASEYWIKVKRMNAIFFYGTLLDTGIRRCVFAESTGDDQIIHARAQGYDTMCYPGETYPVLVPAAGAVTRGHVLLDPSDEALERMVFFEGGEYELADLPVISADGETIQARYNRASDSGLDFSKPWEYEEWRLAERDNFFEATRLYMERCWGKMTLAEAGAVWQELQLLRHGVNG
ncbi:gamma-glutamylcyclotransferase [Halieaceae bacterium IMCC11814]|uniref:Putative gamma-glutamylcyclotransferase n=2 Tax=Candidatus Marimicrobium litorale TaxID=2518991 RepID=A0ABT3T2T0_9GAMM|nr:gamma-glutamylcyclotransferase [Candidatus Marimicrobium litorale]